MICMFCTFKFNKTAHIFTYTNDNVAEWKPVGYIYVWYDMYVLHLQVQ